MDFTELSGLKLYKSLDKIYKQRYNICVRRRKDGTEMKKTLYSLMLSEEVMREIDALAHKMGTNRSNLVNMILAEKVEMRTPEQQMNDIFSGIEQLLASSRELIPLFAPNTQRVTVRSSLEYKYHPTVRYEVELVSGFVPGEPIGTLTANSHGCGGKQDSRDGRERIQAEQKDPRAKRQHRTERSGVSSAAVRGVREVFFGRRRKSRERYAAADRVYTEADG